MATEGSSILGHFLAGVDRRMAVMFAFTSGSSVDFVAANFSMIAVGGNLAFFAIQGLLTRRLVQKNYRSFRVYVIHDDGTRSRDLSIRQAVSVWLWILGPQLALLLLVSVVVSFWGSKLPPDTVRGFSSMSQWLRFLVVGPYAVGLALGAKYPGFRLEAHGFSYV